MASWTMYQCDFDGCRTVQEVRSGRDIPRGWWPLWMNPVGGNGTQTLFLLCTDHAVTIIPLAMRRAAMEAAGVE